MAKISSDSTLKIAGLKIPLVFAFILILAAGVMLLGSGSKSLIGTSLIYDSNSNPMMKIEYSASSFNDRTTVTKGNLFGNNILLQDIVIDNQYGTPYFDIPFSTTSDSDVKCRDLLNPLNPTSVGVKIYLYTSPNSPTIKAPNTIKISAGGIVIDTKTLNLRDVITSPTGIVIESLRLSDYGNTNLNIGDVSLLVLNNNPDTSYLISGPTFKTLLAKSNVNFNFYGIPIQTDLCPLGSGPSGLFNIMKSAAEQSQPPPDSMGRTDFSKKIVTLSTPPTVRLPIAQNEARHEYTVSIPASVGSTVIWAPQIAKPRIASMTCPDGKVDQTTLCSYSLCNDGITSGIDVQFISTGGAVAYPQFTTLSVAQNACQAGTFTLVKIAPNASGQVIMKASSYTNSDSKTIGTQTSGTVVPPVDYCVLHPSECKPPTPACSVGQVVSNCQCNSPNFVDGNNICQNQKQGDNTWLIILGGIIVIALIIIIFKQRKII